MTGMRRERKVVTVVFVDLVGFTARSEAMDPEDVEMELDRYHARVRHELERHGGTVEKFIGDAVMAVFGAPVAHEDDPERAVRAALAVRDWATTEANLEMRVGVYTGETLVRLDARAEAGEGLAVGDVVNTASRLQSAAPTNGIVVGEATYRATSAQIEYREAEPVIAKGKSEPIPIWEAVSARSQFGVDVEQAPRTVFVGRDNEVGLLRGALARARDQREPQLVTLVGVPGMGKSRLVYELSRIVDDDPDLVTWRQGRCLSYGDGVSMWALAEIVKAQAGIFETDEPATADEKLAKTVDALEFDGDRAWLSEQLRPLIGLGGADASRSSRDEQFAAWQQFLEALAETSPAVLIFEDLHWADDLLLDFLDEFADRASGVPLLIVCTARPELLTKRPNWGAGRTNALTLSLPPLSEDHTRTLVRELVTSAIADDLQHAVLERADGNPLYAEEFARMLAERPTQDIVIPDTVQGILAARLDALAPQDKRLLQAAAVIGKVFWAGALEAGTGLARADIDVSLRELERREMVRRDRRSSVAGDIEYAFRHILVRDVAYGQLPRADRSEFHRKTAEWIAALGRPEDYAELIAHHYVSALDYARAANRDATSFVDATRTALRNAGERAAGLRAHSSAVEFFRRALDLAVGEPDRGELLVAYGNAQWAHAGAGLDSLAEGAEELARLGRAEDAADAIIFISRSEAASGALDASERWLDAADRLLAGLAGSPLRYKSLLARAATLMMMARFADALELIAPHLGDIERLGRADLLARALDLNGALRVMRGDAGGLDDQWRAVEIARAGRAVAQLNVALLNLYATLQRLGRLAETASVLDLRQQTVDTFGAGVETRLYLLNHTAWYSYYVGSWDHALSCIDEMERINFTDRSFIGLFSMRLYRAVILGARDAGYDPRAVVREQLAQALNVDAELRVDALPEAVEALSQAGALDEALPLWEETRSVALTGHSTIDEDQMLCFAWTAVRLGREADALEAVSQLADTPWRSAADAVVRHEFATAQDLLAEMGHKVGAARAGLYAGGDRLPPAMEFFRSIGAERYVAIGEAALRGDDRAR